MQNEYSEMRFLATLMGVGALLMVILVGFGVYMQSKTPDTTGVVTSTSSDSKTVWVRRVPVQRTDYTIEVKLDGGETKTYEVNDPNFEGCAEGDSFTSDSWGHITCS